MGYVNCPCGNSISDTSSQPRRTGEMICDNDLEEFDSDDTPITEMFHYSTSVWECDKCGRIALGNKELTWFKPWKV